VSPKKLKDNVLSFEPNIAQNLVARYEKKLVDMKIAEH
jgi:hypothetical protein